jgi:hypothetical protein
MASPIISWSDPIEKLVKRIGEESLCYNILHRRSQSYYAYRNHFVAIPTIALSSIIGAITFAVGNRETTWSSTLLGSLNVLTAFIGTLGSYFRFAQLSENHRIVAIQYNKMYQLITAQLALSRELREPVAKMLDIIKDTIDRLQEVAPEIPHAVLVGFKHDFAHYENVARPSITNGLESIEINVEPPPVPRTPVPSYRAPTPPPPSPIALEPPAVAPAQAPKVAKVWR